MEIEHMISSLNPSAGISQSYALPPIIDKWQSDPDLVRTRLLVTAGSASKGGKKQNVLRPSDVAAGLSYGMPKLSYYIFCLKYCNDSVFYKQAVSLLGERVRKLGAKNNWHLKHGYAQQLAFLSLYEILVPARCSECGGKGHNKQKVTCKKCEGSGLQHRYNDATRAKLAKMPRKTFCDSWSARADLVYNLAADADRKALEHLYRQINHS